MGYPKFVVPNQKEEFISIQKVKQSVISIDFSGCMELSEKCNGQQVFVFHSFKLRANFRLPAFQFVGSVVAQW